MKVNEIIRHYRVLRGLTQAELANQAGVSLPTVQKIESGFANPSLTTIETLFKTLGLQLHYKSENTNWDLLIHFGVPLTTDHESSHEYNNASQKEFVKALLTACQEINKGSCVEREKEAVQSMLLALKNHYPTFFKKHLNNASEVHNLMPSTMTPRLIKLKRLTLARLAHRL